MGDTASERAKAAELLASLRWAPEPSPPPSLDDLRVEGFRDVKTGKLRASGFSAAEAADLVEVQVALGAGRRRTR